MIVKIIKKKTVIKTSKSKIFLSYIILNFFIFLLYVKSYLIKLLFEYNNNINQLT